MHWWGDFPLGTTLWILAAFLAVLVLTKLIGDWWDGRKKK